MFRRPAATLTELDIIDGLKEGTNMIAGNIKVYLPELSDSDACCLTVPEVLDPLENGGHSTVLPLVEKRFECGGEFLGVSVCLSGDAGANLVKPAQQSAHSS